MLAPQGSHWASGLAQAAPARPNQSTRWRQLRRGSRPYSLATMTSDALMIALASSPTLSPSSCTASILIDAVITRVPGDSDLDPGRRHTLNHLHDPAFEHVPCAELHCAPPVRIIAQHGAGPPEAGGASESLEASLVKLTDLTSRRAATLTSARGAPRRGAAPAGPGPCPRWSRSTWPACSAAPRRAASIGRARSAGNAG